VYGVGVYLVYLAFQIIFNYQSKWITESGSKNVEEQTPDGVLYHNIRSVMNSEEARIVTFAVIPFVLVLIGSKFIRNGQKLNLN
jgi:hypothetical protein